MIEEFQIKAPYEEAMDLIPQEAHLTFDRQFEYYKKYAGEKYLDPYQLPNRVLFFDYGFYDYLKDN